METQSATDCIHATYEGMNMARNTPTRRMSITFSTRPNFVNKFKTDWKGTQYCGMTIK